MSQHTPQKNNLYNSPEVKNNRSKQAETYMTQIEVNPFQLDNDDSIYAARVAARQIKVACQKAQEYIPVHKRVDNQVRSAMLNLQDKSIPQILTQIQQEKEKLSNIKLKATTLKEDELNKYAPQYTNKFGHLTPEDQKFLQELERNPGPREKLDRFIQHQKDIFLVELSSQTKQQEIDSINAQVIFKENQLNKQEKQLDMEIQKFDLQVRQSDQSISQTVLQLEQVQKQRQQRDENVCKLKNHLIMINSNIEKLEHQLKKYTDFQNLIEDLMNLITLDLQQKRERILEQKDCIQMCCDQYKTADSLCLDCYIFKNSNQIVMKDSKFAASLSDCKHTNVINYESINNNPQLDLEYEFLTNSKNVDIAQIHELLSQTKNNIYVEIVQQLFTKHISSITDQNNYQFLEALRIFESNNFQLVEQIQEIENMLEQNKKHLKNTKIIHQQNIDQKNNEYNNLIELQKDTTQLQELNKLDRLQQVSNKYQHQNEEILQHITQGFIIAMGVGYQEAISTSTLSQLSQMEQKLEQLAVICKKRVPAAKQGAYERMYDRQRQKKISMEKKQEEEQIRQEKIEKQLIKNQEPLKSTDMRRVIYKTQLTPKRKLTNCNEKQGEVQQIDENFFDVQEMEWIEGVGWRMIGSQLQEQSK